MRVAGMIGFALALLTVEGSILALFHIELLKPDFVLILVVFLALKCEPVPGSFAVFLLGLLADSFAGMSAGVLTIAYLLIWVFTRIAQFFFLPQQRMVQLTLVFFGSLILLLYFLLFWPSLGQRQGGVWQIGIWSLPFAFLNSVLAIPIWSLADRIMGMHANNQRSMFLKTR